MPPDTTRAWLHQELWNPKPLGTLFLTFGLAAVPMRDSPLVSGILLFLSAVSGCAFWLSVSGKLGFKRIANAVVCLSIISVAAGLWLDANQPNVPPPPVIVPAPPIIVQTPPPPPQPSSQSKPTELNTDEIADKIARQLLKSKTEILNDSEAKTLAAVTINGIPSDKRNPLMAFEFESRHDEIRDAKLTLLQDISISPRGIAIGNQTILTRYIGTLAAGEKKTFQFGRLDYQSRSLVRPKMEFTIPGQTGRYYIEGSFRSVTEKSMNEIRWELADPLKRGRLK
jgi:hypothetical protein